MMICASRAFRTLFWIARPESLVSPSVPMDMIAAACTANLSFAFRFSLISIQPPDGSSILPISHSFLTRRVLDMRESSGYDLSMEAWVGIPGYNFYEVSDWGQVRSLPHLTKVG